MPPVVHYRPAPYSGVLCADTTPSREATAVPDVTCPGCLADLPRFLRGQIALANRAVRDAENDRDHWAAQFAALTTKDGGAR